VDAILNVGFFVFIVRIAFNCLACLAPRAPVFRSATADALSGSVSERMVGIVRTDWR
jgi:hypothetical protein